MPTVGDSPSRFPINVKLSLFFMCFILGLLLLVLIIVAIMYFIGARMPLAWEEENAVLIKCSIDEVYEYLRDLKTWGLWLARTENRKSRRLSFRCSEASTKIGASAEWNATFLKEKLTLTHLQDGKSIEYVHEIGTRFTLKGSIFVAVTNVNHVQVAWRVSATPPSSENIPLRYQSYYLRRYVTETIEMSLTNLKILLENKN